MLFLRGRQLEGSCLHSQQTWVTNKKPLSLLLDSSLRSAATNYCGLRTNCPLWTRQTWLYTDIKTLQVGIIALKNGQRQLPNVAQCGNLCGHILHWRLLCKQDQRGRRVGGGRGLQRWLKDYSIVWAACSSLERITHKNMVQAWQIVLPNDST